MSYQKLVLAILLIAAACPAQTGKVEPDLRLLFTGDIMLSRQVQAQYSLRKRSPWNNLKALFAKADWVGGNFEGTIGDSSQCLSAKNCFAT
jgi:poly-gamma-glutamate synthesis protein (capsule biosynthesis protein)